MTTLPTADSLRSLITGMGDPNVDKSAAVFYGNLVLSDNQLHNAYRNTWLAKKIVNIPALDALRKWRDWQAEQTQITLIENEERRLGLKQKMLQCKTLARLWGGAVIFIGDGTDAAQPFYPDKVEKGGLKYLTVMSRREMIANELQIDPESEQYGWPIDYTISNGRQFTTIHPSRLVIQIGDPLPDPWNPIGSVTSTGWGDSVLQSVFTAVSNADSTAANVASLVFEANVDVYKIDELMEHMSSAPYRQKLLDRFSLANIGKSVNKALIVDKDEEYDRKQINFSNLPEVIQQFLIIVSGASDIPLTRLLGQSPSGLNSTGEHDMKNYFDRITSAQTLEIQPALYKLDEALIRSALGSRPDEIFYSWAPLEQMSEKEKAEIGKIKVEAATGLVNTGLFMQEELRQVVGNQLVEDGFYPGLADLLKSNGDKLPEFDLERRSQEASVKALENPQPKTPVTDATPRTLYLRRDIVNADEIIKWYKDQGVQDVYAPESMHVTIVYTKTPVDWMKMGQPWEARLEIPDGGPRINEKFGDQGDVLVLLFASNELQWRHLCAKEIGATSDYPEYQPHISISLRGGELDLINLKPWQGPIVLGPEIYEEVKTGDWREKVETE